MVRVQQSGHCPVLDLGGEFPPEIGRVLQAQVEPGSSDGGVHVGGVTDQ